MTPTVESAPDTLVAALRMPVWNILTERADGIRRDLPLRPETTPECLAWLHALNPEQARRAALLDHLDALRGHVIGCPALGYAVDDPMPDAALQEAEGFNPRLTTLIAVYRAARQHRANAPQ
ncbi:hypothetical protein [Streptomyces sp. IBSBF 3136]|uniref:hypothetical protein n=1 Tax=Streptomyces sp. IBSBF 3136 TaxID=2903524 RepID=UPI002FDC043E